MIIHSNGEEIAFNQFGSFKGVSRWDIYEKKSFLSILVRNLAI